MIVLQLLSFLRRLIMKTISTYNLKTHMLKIFREIESSGEELIITDHNKPVIKLKPVKEKYNVEKLFEDFQGKIVFKEEINTSTEDEWDLLK